ncbi:phosphoribosylanthranilate isomerase [Chryseobacterium arthrosphaerae]|uniref:N-(5'-phosphoribosyl)anthranilate isomerase n=1 Tax=Chryseobacterium arthrosphaerae TaxID=651561 RepID=A0ABU7QZ47_9FLAO|nr:phosphoribosylanthranilate isomerase [Chryseobacterium arthrosphaerae]
MNHQHSPKLKVCGLIQPDQIKELIAINTDFLGFIFYEKSPRYVLNHLTLEDISKIDHQGKTGVFVNEKIDKVVEIAEKARLNIIQLHGDEDSGFITSLKEKLPEIQIIKVIRISSVISEDKESLLNFKHQFSGSLHPIQNAIDFILFDTDSKGFGGTGHAFDWSILQQLELSKPYFLSGGISEENINETETLHPRPFALDINSKFEIEPGHKDISKIKKFMSVLSIESPNRTT